MAVHRQCIAEFGASVPIARAEGGAQTTIGNPLEGSPIVVRDNAGCQKWISAISIGAEVIVPAVSLLGVPYM